MEESRQDMEDLIVTVSYDKKKEPAMLVFKPKTTGIIVDLSSAMPDAYKEYIIYLPDRDFSDRYEPTLFASEHKWADLAEILGDRTSYNGKSGIIVTEHKAKYSKDPNDTWIMQNYNMRAVLVIPGMETPRDACIPPGNAKPAKRFSSDSLEGTIFNLTDSQYRSSKLDGPGYQDIRKMLDTL